MARIHIVGCKNDVTRENFIEEATKIAAHNFFTIDTRVTFPEVEDGFPLHEQAVFDKVYKLVKEAFETNRRLFIISYSVHALNAVRVAIKDLGVEGEGIVHNLFMYRDLPDTKVSDIRSAIIPDGRLTHWEGGVYDTWDTTLDKIL